MSQNPYIEDIFLDFFEALLINRVTIQHQDRSAASSFYTTISNGNALTKNQANYVLRILEKYKNTMLDLGLDYIEDIKNPQWQQPFRVIDMSRKVFVEMNEDKEIFVCLKFPYQILESFNSELFDEFDESIRSSWDPERKLRLINIYDANLIHIYEFCKKHEFDIDDTFMIALSEVEEIWQNQESILPCSIINDNLVILKNANRETLDWFENNKTKNIINDLLLAKRMGYQLNKIPKNPIEKIASSKSSMFFWKQSIFDLLTICKNLSGTIAIILERSSESIEWLETITNSAEQAGFTNKDIKIGFRSKASDDSGFNEWVAKKGYGGKMDDGKILIFNHKPPKWLFKNEIPVTMLITNALIPSTNRLTKNWILNHPCVMFVNDIKPTPYSEIEIVDL